MDRIEAISVAPYGQSIERAGAIKAAALALVFGIGIVFSVGFAGPNILHNAAHDSRHALGFPCH